MSLKINWIVYTDEWVNSTEAIIIFARNHYNHVRENFNLKILAKP